MELKESEGGGQVPSLLAERAPSEGPRSTGAVGANMGGLPLEMGGDKSQKKKDCGQTVLSAR